MFAVLIVPTLRAGWVPSQVAKVVSHFNCVAMVIYIKKRAAKRLFNVFYLNTNQIVHAGGETAGDASAAIASADKALAITPAATNCGWGQVGSQVSFYCRTAGRWLVRVKGRNLGTGTGGTIAFA